ncbi:IS21-like element helper ATPase IstB [Gloeobacter violaceus]|uniref:Gll4066 protein n=1 Tax=Gloeobacter violaceus (strain ATCC 29082 / PCC 7421) TaxID=251221 RepID=Q7NE14_GLOVI|nr:IS21-like element helper ATPase IstB [Gloeobacter violaceus]BAC92007.1 gll4066 [Gloeobacter violaceus PCC 7421]
MSEASLEVLLKALRLGFIGEQVERIEAQAVAEGWSHSRFLKCLCEFEHTERENRRLARYLKDARLPVGKSLSGFDFAACTKLERRRVQQLAADSTWVKRAENVLLFGPSGVGKTHLAAGVGLAMVEKGIPVRYFTATNLVQLLQQAKLNLALEKQLVRLDHYPVVVIDDIGYVKRSESESSVLFELIAHRYERHSLVITSNHPFRDWDQIFSDTTMTVSAVDRLVHHATLIEIEAESYRKKAAQARQQRQSAT